MNNWMQNHRGIGWPVLLLCFVFGLAGQAIAAQSTIDAVADDALKEKLRREIIGSATFPGEEQEYVIGYGDVLGISVYGEGDMAASAAGLAGRPGTQNAAGREDALRRPGSGVEVRLDGRISLLHVGDVNVVGMTLTQLADYLKSIYATVFTDPVITTVLIQGNSRRYTVMGQVQNPGIFYIDYPITLIQTIARSGGFTEWASHNLTVVRQGDGLHGQSGNGQGETSLNFDYDAFIKGKNLKSNVYVRSGDVIIVH